MKKTKEKKLALEIFDSLFIMLLCFATLLSAMLLKNNSGAGLDYTIHVKTLITTFLGLAIYLLYMLNRSDKGLKTMINYIYPTEKFKEEDKK
ncbi:hypothetical protein [Acetobacterium bakii]|uniref:RDD domain-containing protein n=1 Tax=Acetobacterium bakii TaxID=52689 RepID=A0A0L6U322_9FIRM|nr:hypothetical protein [Acetobacterium bakii]KNZ42200.1 hypothetical protein AKG39_07860 [Acetobacterium bakii]